MPTIIRKPAPDITFEQFIAEQDRLTRMSSRASAKLQTYPRSSVGLTPDAVKFSPGYRADKAAHDRAFNALRRWNGKYAGSFVRERLAARQQRLAAKAGRAAA